MAYCADTSGGGTMESRGVRLVSDKRTPCGNIGGVSALDPKVLMMQFTRSPYCRRLLWALD